MYCISDWFGRLQIGIIPNIIPAYIIIIIISNILGGDGKVFTIIVLSLLIYIFGVPLISLLPGNQK